MIQIVFWSHAHNRAPAWLNCSPSGIPCDPSFVARSQETHMIQIFLFALLRARSNPCASREPSLPNFLSGRGRTRTTQRSFWARPSAELHEGDPEFSVRILRSSRGNTHSPTPFIYRQASAYSSSIFGTRSRSGYTSELAGWILPGPRMSASCALALVKRVFFV